MLPLDLRYRIFFVVVVFAHLHRAESYVTAADCDPYYPDIQNAVEDASQSLGSAGRALTMGIDFFGLTSTIFPNIDSRDNALEKLNLTFIYRQAYSRSIRTEFASVAAAQQAELDDDADTGNEGLDPVLFSIYFSCDPTTFSKVGLNQWFDTVTQQLYTSTANDMLCGSGVKVMTATSVRPQDDPNAPMNADNGPPRYLVVILCPSVLTQTAGEPKMYADLAGTELSNTRPNFVGVKGQRLTAEETLDLLAWKGMFIDQLRERVLSVYIARVIILAIGAKFWQRTHVRSSISLVWDFGSVKLLSLYSAVGNIDAMSIYATGARFYYGEISAYEDLHDQLPSPGTQAWDEAIHRWNADGVLEDNSLQGIRDALHQQEP